MNTTKSQFSSKAHPAKAGAAKLRVLASSATPASRPAIDATRDPTTAEPPTGDSAVLPSQLLVGAGSMRSASWGLLAAVVGLCGLGCGGGSDLQAPPTATTIAINTGNHQSAAPGSAVAIAPSVKITDGNSDGVSGVSVTFAVASGGG
jgi:hypothetical protein